MLAVLLHTAYVKDGGLLSNIFFNRKIQKHSSTFNLRSNRQYGLHKWRPRRSSYSLNWLRCFGETFPVPLSISKVFDRVYHMAIFSKLPLFIPIFPFISKLLSRRFISTAVEGHCYSPKAINSAVPKGSVVTHNLLSSFFTDPVLPTDAVTTLFHSTSLNREPSRQKLLNSDQEAAEHWIPNNPIISNWGKKNLCASVLKKIDFSKSTRKNIRKTYPQFFYNTRSTPSWVYPWLKTLTGTFTFPLHKLASSRFGSLYRLYQFFSLPNSCYLYTETL